MFCKWCGNTIQTVDERCPVCGRETPPMSDCGGFYNLKYALPGQLPEPTPPKPAAQCPIVKKMEPKYAADQKKARNHYKVTLLLAACLVLLTAIYAIGFWRLYAQVGGLEAMLLNKSMEPVVTEPTGEATEETEQTNEVKMPHSFRLDMTVGESENVEVGVNSSFAAYTQGGKFRISVMDDEQGKTVDACYMTEQEGSSVKLTVIKGLDMYGKVKVHAACDTDIMLFEDASCEYHWQYREAEGKWTDVDTEMVLRDEQGIDYVLWGMAWETEPLAEPIELRCSIRMENSEGDEMILTADGIFLVSGEEKTIN